MVLLRLYNIEAHSYFPQMPALTVWDNASCSFNCQAGFFPPRISAAEPKCKACEEYRTLTHSSLCHPSYGHNFPRDLVIVKFSQAECHLSGQRGEDSPSPLPHVSTSCVSLPRNPSARCPESVSKIPFLLRLMQYQRIRAEDPLSSSPDTV